MGCCGGDRERGPVSEEQRWDYINLSDFRSRGCVAPFSYIWLLILAIVGIAVYVADTFTAVNLVAFNRWSSQVKPKIPFEIGKWIFFACICLSFVLLVLEYLRAIRVMRGGGVADSYLDPRAAVFQSLRPGQGQGWRRFLVFTELTKSRKGTDYIALFVYFQFKGAFRVILAEGPRQVINAITLYSVLQADLIPKEKQLAKGDMSTFDTFFNNVKVLAESNNLQAVILCSMLFTLVIWVLNALGLIISFILYILFLWHHIPSADGTLAAYCRRKADQRLERIVGKKVSKAIERSENKRLKEEQKAGKKFGEKGPELAKPTLPSFGAHDDAKSEFSLNRQDSFATLPPYTAQMPSRTNTMTTTSTQQDNRRPFPPARTATQSSNASYASNAPLLSEASEMGYSDSSRARSPLPTLPPLSTSDTFGDPTRSRPMTPGSTGNPLASQRPYSPMTRPGTAQGRNSPMGVRPNPYGPPGPSRQNSEYSNGRNSPLQIGPPGPMIRQNTYGSANGRIVPGPSPLASEASFSPFGRSSPAPGPAYEMSPVDANLSRSPASLSRERYLPSPSAYDDDYDPYRPKSPESTSQQSYTAYNLSQVAPVNDSRQATPPERRPLPSAVLQSAIQRREASNPLPSRVGASSVPPQQMQRSATAPFGAHMYTQNQNPVQRSMTGSPSRQGAPGNGWN